MVAQKKTTKKAKQYKLNTVFKGRNLGELYKIIDIGQDEYKVVRIPDTNTYEVNGKTFELIFKPHWLSTLQIERNLSLCWEQIL